jgi:acetyl esterase/lipase
MFRLILSIIVFLLGLLCIFEAPEYHLWLVSVVATEFPWVFMAVILLLLLWGRVVRRYRTTGNIICLLALACFLYPVTGAYIISANLDKNFEAAFGTGSLQQKGYKDGKPFSFTRMFSGREPQEPFKTLTYVTTPAGPLTMDYYQPQMKTPQPCVIVIHGGSWCSGNSQQLPELNTYLAQCGYNVASINYRLAPENKWPVQLDDVHAALSYLRTHAAELNVDTNNFVLLGRSAGGQIALAAAYTLNEPGLKGVIDFYGPADMAWGYNHPANPLVLDTRKIMTDYLGGTVTEVPQNYAASSATEIATGHSVPTLMIFGKNDPLVPYTNGTKLNSILNAKGVENFLLLLPWATHGCDYTLHGPSGQLSTYTVEQFLYFVTHQYGQVSSF